MIRMILRLDSKRRLTLPASLVPWKPGDYVDVTYIKSENVFVIQRVESKINPLRVIKKFKSLEPDFFKASRQKAKKIK